MLINERIHPGPVPSDCRHGALAKTRAVPALDRAGDMFIADLRDRACDLPVFRVLGQFNDRQPGGWRHEAEQEKCVFQGRLIFLHQRAAVSGTSRSKRCRALCGRASLQFESPGLAQFRRDVRDDGNMHPSPPLATTGSAVVSSPSQNSRNPPAGSGRKRNKRVRSPVPSLNPMKRLEAGELQQRVVGQVSHGPRMECRAG